MWGAKLPWRYCRLKLANVLRTSCWCQLSMTTSCLSLCMLTWLVWCWQVLGNGDLVIGHVSWADNMGLYRCVAENTAGSDHVDTFLYPVRTHNYTVVAYVCEAFLSVCTLSKTINRSSKISVDSRKRSSCVWRNTRNMRSLRDCFICILYIRVFYCPVLCQTPENFVRNIAWNNT